MPENHDINETITAEIQHCEERFLEAIRNSDIDHLDFLIHDNLLFVGPDGTLVTKMMDLEKYRSQALTIETLTVTDPTISAMGDTAIVSVIQKIVGELDTILIDNEFRYLRIWKKIGDSWQIIAGSCTIVQ